MFSNLRKRFFPSWTVENTPSGSNSPVGPKEAKKPRLMPKFVLPIPDAMEDLLNEQSEEKRRLMVEQFTSRMVSSMLMQFDVPYEQYRTKDHSGSGENLEVKRKRLLDLLSQPNNEARDEEEYKFEHEPRCCSCNKLRTKKNLINIWFPLCKHTLCTVCTVLLRAKAMFPLQLQCPLCITNPQNVGVNIQNMYLR